MKTLDELRTDLKGVTNSINYFERGLETAKQAIIKYTTLIDNEKKRYSKIEKQIAKLEKGLNI